MNNDSPFLFAVPFQSDSLLFKRVVRFIIPAYLLIILVGCASSGVIKNASPVSTSTPVSHDFVVVETSSSLSDAETQRRLLNALIISGLKETQKFGHVNGNKIAVSLGSGMKVNVNIKEINKVSDSARAWVGTFAGQARILVQVTVADLKSGNQIEAFQAEGKSSGGSVFAGTTDQAIQLAADQVVAEVVKISSQTSQ
jgi:Domain of unknown function (DUF4410)